MELVRKVPLPEDVHRVLVSHKTDVNDLFIRRFQCTAEVSGSRPAATTAPVLVYEKRLLTGPLISVWLGDLTTQDTDVVVNAANEHLEHIGGLALALVNAGGQQIIQESKAVISRQGVLAAGDIAVTSAGMLPSRCIVHAVGPRWSEGTAEQCKAKLSQAICKVLDYVSSQRDLRSVAIPAVSSGIFGFPLDLCASIMVEVVKSHCHTENVSRLKEIRLVNHDDKTVQAMKSACELVLGQSDTPSGAASSSAQAWHQGATSQMATSLTVNGLSLHLKMGRIEEEKTSVIVNSISPGLSLSHGAISSAIYSKAGPQLQDELRRKRQQFGSMIPTRGHNLPCRYVYHVILQPGEWYAEKSLREATMECLMAAHRFNSSSISFPALGTGNIGLQKHKVANIMMQTVLDFARAHQCRMEVNFVIHPSDGDTFQAFLDKFRASRITNHKNMKFIENPKGSEPSDEGMCVTITGGSGEDVVEAVAWLLGVLSPSPLLIHNTHLLLFGSEEFDALSSCPPSVDIEEDLRDGRVTLKISGPLPERAAATVQVERLLLDVQDELAQSLEAELLEAAVIWFFESQSESHRYSAKANRELERAFASQRSFILSAAPGHVIDFTKLTAKERERTFTLRRRCLRDSLQNIQMSPTPSQTAAVEPSSPEFREQSAEFRKAGLILEKMEKVQNELLSGVFQSKKDAVGARSSEPLYQLVPRQFSRTICDVGFHRVYATPRDTTYGSGVYFKKTLLNITHQFQCPEKDGQLCILQAEVVTSCATKYARNQPLLPCIGSDALQVYEGLVDGGNPGEHYVIFDRFQANPRYVFTCRSKE